MRKLTYYIAVSQDGYIAGPDGQIDAFDQGQELIGHIASHLPETLPAPARHHLGIDGPNKRFDTALMGRATYAVGADQGLTSPYAHLDRQIVFSRSVDPDVDPGVEVVSGDPLPLIRRLKEEDGLDIWLCGGGDLATQLADEIDELIVKRQPITLGAGIPMFSGSYAPQRYERVESVPVGPIVIETYRRDYDPGS